MQAYRIVLLLVAFSTVAATAQEGGLDKYRINFSLQEIRDPQMNNELAITIAVPAGWRIQNPNIIQWNPMTYQDPARIAYTLTGPKDEATCWSVYGQSFRYDYGAVRVGNLVRQQRAAMDRQIQNLMNQQGINAPYQAQQVPEYKENMVDEGCLVKQPLSAEAYLQSIFTGDTSISQVRFTKSWKPERVVEDLKRALPEMTRKITGMLTQSGSTIAFKGMTADTAVVEFTCVKDGKQYEQQAAVIIVYTRMASSGNVLTGANDDIVYWSVSPLVSAFALKGKLKSHDLEFATIMGNSLVNPVWQAKVTYLVSETNRKIIANRLESQQQIQQSMNETFNYMAKARQDVFQGRQDSMSKVMQGMTDAITGTDRVRGDDGKIYAVPMGTLPERKVPWAWGNSE